MANSLYGPNLMFDVFPYIFFAVFAVILGVILAAVIRSVKRGIQNKNAPVLAVDTRLVTKRTETGGGMGDTSAWTHYYVTFEVESGDRLEFQISGEQSGMLAEGDEGKLTFQGTRFISFHCHMID